MGKLKSLEVIYNNPMAVYYPGQHLQGTVIVELNESLSMRGIRVQFSGYAHVHWSETHSSGKHTHTRHYSSHETYFDAACWVFGRDGGDEQLAAGRHSYNFQFTLPAQLPSSYESGTGQVRYFCKAIIDIPMWFDHTAKRPFTIINLLDLNTKPETLNGVQASNEKNLCCLCCKSGPIRATLHLQRTGYVPGEAIACFGEVENLSSRNMNKSVMELVQVVHYHATTKTRTLSHPVTSIDRPAIPPGGQDQWNGTKLLIPAIPPSFLVGCGIIDIRYYLSLKVVPAGPALNLSAPVEVIIGGIPHRQIIQANPPLPFAPAPQHSGPSSDQLYGAGPSAFSNMPPPPSMPSNIPPPSYSESVFGKQNVGDEGDNHDMGGYNNFAPVYTYYNWNNEQNNQP